MALKRRADPAMARRVKEAVNRLVEHSRYRQRVRAKEINARGLIRGQLAIAERGVNPDP